MYRHVLSHILTYRLYELWLYFFKAPSSNFMYCHMLSCIVMCCCVLSCIVMYYHVLSCIVMCCLVTNMLTDTVTWKCGTVTVNLPVFNDSIVMYSHVSSHIVFTNFGSIFLKLRAPTPCIVICCHVLSCVVVY